MVRSAMKAYKFRIYPNGSQQKMMESHLEMSRQLWNHLLEETKNRYEKEKRFYKRSELQSMSKGTGLHSQTSQGVAHRLNRAIRTKIWMKKNGLKWGFPRFKKFGRFKTLYYPQSGFKLENKLKVTPFGKIKIRQHRPIEGRIKTLTLKREPTGKWFAIFVSDATMSNNLKAGKGSVGVDLGLKAFATLSDGNKIDNPRVFKKYENKLAQRQRKLSNKKKGSANRQKARLKVAKIHEKIKDVRKDFLHKVANEMIQNYSFIALEKLNSQAMSQGWFGKSINDASWSMFTRILSYKAESAGCKVVFVNPNNTTRECSGCGEIVKKELCDRVHSCPKCGLVIDRDLNASRNILMKATVGTTGSNACGDEKYSVDETGYQRLWPR
ncbi:MAG: RNA-guided endonuclease TnpB family protein [Candidatus Aenigmatarchaeota archaeon]